MPRSRGQSDVTLGAGHVAGIFLGFVVLCGIFFTLGYVLGRDHTSTPVSQSQPALDSGANQNQADPNAAKTRWDFYPNKKGGGSGTAATPGLTPTTGGSSAESGPVSMEPKPAHLRIQDKPPVLAGGTGGVSLQVAALSNQSDALALAGFLKQKGYPAFAWGPAPDRLYHVQVGPYPNTKAAEAAKTKLEAEGFKSIVKK